MARDAVVTCTAGTWTQITDGAVTTDISLAVMSRRGLWIRATATASAPADTVTEGFPLPNAGDGWSEATIAEKFPGVSGAQHLYGRPMDVSAGSAAIRISHA